MDRDHFRSLLIVALAAALGGCGGLPSSPPPPPPGSLPTPSVACAAEPVLQLAAGEHNVFDPATTEGCVRFPAAGAGGAQYLLTLASASGARSSSGIQSSYLLQAGNPASALMAAASIEPELPIGRRPSAAAQFDGTLRRLERDLAADPANRFPALAAPAPPAHVTVGDSKTFKTCANLQCSSFGNVQATAKFVGQHVAVYMDDDVPTTDPMQDADFADLGNSFDLHHYPIDTAAFGRESDIDGNGVVIVLMTNAVNDLTPDCTNGRVVGYFFGGDLLPGANSNRMEMFYTLVPAPATSKCTAVTRRQAVDNLKPTLIHEFQHMISFNQHALIRSGGAEEVWLNESFSHFAEELGGRLIPNSECTPSFSSCRSQYAGGDIIDAYDFAANTEAVFTVYPTSSPGTLEERGASWLLLRWVLDHFAADSILSTALTRAMVATSLTGVANIEAATGGSFSQMVPEWLMATYLDDGPDLPFEATGRLRFKSWGLRSIWTDPRNQSTATPPGPFNGFPMNLDIIGGSYSRSGTLRGGSGRVWLVLQPANGPAIDVHILRNPVGEDLDPAVVPRLGVVRIR